MPCSLAGGFSRRIVEVVEQRQEMELYVRPPGAQRVDECAAFEDVAGQQPAPEALPLQEMAHRPGPVFSP